MATTTFTPSQLRGINSSFPYKNYGLWAPEITGGGGGGGFTNTFSLAFDGVDDFVSIPETSYSGAFSISLWINPEDFTLQFICGENSGNQNYIWAQTSTLLWFTAGGTATSFTESGGNDLLAGQWQNLIITRDSSNNVNVYRNGVAFGSTTTNAGTFKLDAIGKAGAAASWIYHGNIDEVAIWNNDQTANISTISTSPVVDLTSLNPTLWLRNGDNGTFKSPQWLIPNNENKTKFSNYSFSYDGIDDYVNCGTDSSLKPTSAYSVSGWFKLDDLTGTKTIISNDNNNGYMTWVAGDKLWFYHYDTNWRTITSNTTLVADTWYHFALTWDLSSTTGNLYINGVFDNQNTSFNQVTYLSTPVYIGTYGPSVYFEGNIDEVSVFNKVLTPTEISSIYNSGVPTDISSLSPVGYWRSEQSNFTDNWLVDNSALSNYSTRSFNFDGVDDSINCGDVLHNDGQTPMTVSAWINVSTDGDYPIAGKKKVRSAPLYAMNGWDVTLDTAGISKNKLTFQLIGVSSGGVGLGVIAAKANGFDFNDGLWHHVVVTYDGSEDASGVKFYRDGVEDTNVQILSNTFSGNSVNDPSVDFKIGTRPKYSGNDFYNGSMDELAIWSTTALTQEQITTIYNSGTPARIEGATSHWRMGEDATFNTNWNVPDNAGSATGTSANMTISDLKGEAPNYTGGGLSNNMTIEDRVGDASNSSNNALSYNMDEADRETDVPS